MPDKTKILVIDDEVDFCHFLKLNMEVTGEFEVKVFADGKAGLDTAKSWHPDLILLDMRMPGISGPEIAAALKQDQASKDIPVIFLTGLAVKEATEEDSLKDSGSIIITKPVTTADIIKLIKPILAKKQKS